MSAGNVDLPQDARPEDNFLGTIEIKAPPLEESKTADVGAESRRGPVSDADIAQEHAGKLAERDTADAVAEMEEFMASRRGAQATGEKPGDPGAEKGKGGESDQVSVEELIKQAEGNGEQWWQAVLRNVSPVEMMGGALDYADNAFETARMISAKGDEALMGMGVPALTFGPDGVGTTTDYDEFAQTQNIGDALPDIGDPNKPGLARSVGKFVAGFAVAGRALSGVQSLRTLAESGRFGQSAVAALKGAISDFSGLGEMEGNLANVIQDFPALQNPITDFLEADDETPELVNKLKTALVGAGIGMAVDGVMAGLRTIRASRQLKSATDEMDQLAGGLIREAETQRGMLRDALGDPDDARLIIDDAAEAVTDSVDDAIKLEPIGMARQPVLDTALSELDDQALEAVEDTVTERLGNLESLLDETPDLADVDMAFRRDLIEAQDAFSAVELEKFRRSLEWMDGDLLAMELRGLSMTSDEDKVRALLIVDAAKKRGLEPAMRESMEEFAQRSQAHADSLKGKIDDVAKVVSDQANAPSVQAKALPSGLPEPSQREAGQAASKPRPNESNRVGDVYVNWARIDSEDDVRSIIQQLANRYSDSIDAGRGPVETFAETQAKAATEDAWKLLTERAKGQPLNASQTLAVRELWTASGKAVRDIARRVEAGGSVADQIALKKMIAVHATIQEQVIGIRTETARALAQWRIPAGESDQFLNGMANLMDMMGTDRDVLKIASSINQLADMGRADATDAFILGASKIDDLKRYGANASDIIRQLFYFSLLSGPKTHVRNALSNTAMLLANAVDRRGAALLGEVLGGQNVPNEEAAALLYGQINGVIDAFRISDYAREVAEQTGNKVRSPVMNALLTGQSGVGIGKVEMPRMGAMSAEKLALDPKSNIGRVLDFLDTTTRVLTTNGMAAADEVFRTAQYNGEVHALSFRRAWQEAQSGLIPREQIQARATELARTPDLAIKVLAERFAERSIFANAPPRDSKLWQWIKASGRVPIVGKLMMPFQKTVYNIFTETAQRTLIAPATKHFRTEIAAGGARADIAWTKFLAGNAALVTLADVAVKGGLLGGRRGIGGEESAGEMATDRAMGRTPMSIPFTMEDGSVRTFSFRGLEPLSTHLGMAANVVEILSSDQFDADDKDIEDVVIAATSAVAMQVTNPSFMTGMLDMVGFLDDPLRNGQTFFERTAGIAVPNAVAEVARAMDPNVREVNGMIDAIKAKTPGLSKTLPANTDRWGTDITRESGLGVLYDAVSPFTSTLTKPTPIDVELDRLGVGLAKPGKRVSFDGVDVNMKLHPHAYTYYVKMAGNEMTEDVNGNPIAAVGGLYVSEGGGLRDELSAIVDGRHGFSDYYLEGSDGPDGDKAEAIQSIVNAYRDAAKAHVLLEFPEVRAKVAARFNAKPERVYKRDKGNKFLDMTE